MLAPGGVYLHKVQHDNAPLAASGAWWDNALRKRGHATIRRLRFQDQRDLIRATGAALELVSVCQVVDRNDPEEVLDTTRRRVHSWSWQIADDVFADCIGEHEAWFRTHYRGEIVEEATHELEIWRWPAAAPRPASGRRLPRPRPRRALTTPRLIR